VLVLTHTHAASDEFARRTPNARRCVEIRTIDSLVVEIATAYHKGLRLPADPAAWARGTTDGYDVLAEKVRNLVATAPAVRGMLATRYPVIVCDEHQDATASRHEIVMALHSAGAMLRVFGDPMQQIYPRTAKEMSAADEQWAGLKGLAGQYDELDYPHRWKGSAHGAWMLEARRALRNLEPIDLMNAPAGINVIRADNTAANPLGYIVSSNDRKGIDAAVRSASNVLILTSRNAIVDALCAFFNRALPIWEGHRREPLDALVQVVDASAGDAVAIGKGLASFVEETCKGLSHSVFGNAFVAEIQAGCSKPRKGKPAGIQHLARVLLAEPNHRGVANVLSQLRATTTSGGLFAQASIDYRQTFADALALSEYETASDGLLELSRRRTAAHRPPPVKAVSTIHKAKGLSSEAVVLLPCDEKTFPNTAAARRKLYVALTRAVSSLTIVLPRTKVSPLFKV
jgi:hypothetical protein